jgi:hypothetical protein
LRIFPTPEVALVNFNQPSIFRINGVLESWFDKTWKPGEIEPVKNPRPEKQKTAVP